jgi:hypothetical protein
MPTRLSRFLAHHCIAWRALRALLGIKGPTVESSGTARWHRIAAIARGDRPVLLASLMAGSGLLLALLCAAGAP